VDAETTKQTRTDKGAPANSSWQEPVAALQGDLAPEKTKITALDAGLQALAQKLAAQKSQSGLSFDGLDALQAQLDQEKERVLTLTQGLETLEDKVGEEALKSTALSTNFAYLQQLLLDKDPTAAQKVETFVDFQTLLAEKDAQAEKVTEDLLQRIDALEQQLTEKDTLTDSLLQRLGRLETLFASTKTDATSSETPSPESCSCDCTPMDWESWVRDLEEKAAFWPQKVKDIWQELVDATADTEYEDAKHVLAKNFSKYNRTLSEWVWIKSGIEHMKVLYKGKIPPAFEQRVKTVYDIFADPKEVGTISGVLADMGFDHMVDVIIQIGALKERADRIETKTGIGSFDS
jgi:chromosome segregation ATPase